MKKHILLLDENPKSLQLLQETYEQSDCALELLTSQSASDAFSKIEQHPVEVLMVDMTRPSEQVQQFINQTADGKPQLPRLLITDLSDQRALIKWVGKANQFLIKPCDPITIKAALERRAVIRNWFPSDAVVNLLVKVQKLPSPPGLYYEIIRKLNGHASLEDIGNLIGKDPSLTSKILQLVNSTAFALQNPISSAVEAVLFLGVETTKSLVLLTQSFTSFLGTPAVLFSVDKLWQHALRTATYCQTIAKSQGVEEREIEEIYTAGLLHDLGKLVLAANFSQQFRDANMMAKAKKMPLWEAEQEIFKTNHAEIGACLLAIWGLETSLVESLAFHHQPTRSHVRTFGSLLAVHAGNAIANAVINQSIEVDVDWQYINGCGMGDKISQWLSECSELPPIGNLRFN